MHRIAASHPERDPERETVSLATNVKRLRGDHAQTKRQSAMPINQTASRSRPDFYFELAGMMTDRILA
jgi:hypothetical protein